MNHYKGIILAGGSGTRLYPSTNVISKQLLPIYDKPMIYYPLSVLMLAEIREILIITTKFDIDRFKELLGDGRRWGISIEYAIQENPDGLAQSLIIGEKFLNNSPVCLILGDNLFYGSGITQLLKNAQKEEGLATIFAYMVADSKKYGVVEFDNNNNVVNLEEKPQNPRSNYAITGLYFYDKHVCEYAKSLKPSSRGELEITDLNKIYLQQKKLKVILMPRGFAWLDTGTHHSLLEASNFIQVIESRQGIKIACLEEIAHHKSWITKNAIREQIEVMGNSSYALYLKRIFNF